jgi:hypothetical protein
MSAACGEGANDTRLPLPWDFSEIGDGELLAAEASTKYCRGAHAPLAILRAYRRSAKPLVLTATDNSADMGGSVVKTLAASLQRRSTSRRASLEQIAVSGCEVFGSDVAQPISLLLDDKRVLLGVVDKLMRAGSCKCAQNSLQWGGVTSLIDVYQMQHEVRRKPNANGH